MQVYTTCIYNKKFPLKNKKNNYIIIKFSHRFKKKSSTNIKCNFQTYLGDDRPYFLKYTTVFSNLN
jgi:hypothetical protein